MKLLIDIGNTRLKWAIGNNPDTLIAGESLANNTITSESLDLLWQNIQQPKQIIIAQVGSQQVLESVQATAASLWPRVTITLAKAESHRLGLKNAYPQPEKLGVDRWLGMLAGYHRYQQALCIVACGTAITLDKVDASGQHLGGLISPGLQLMKEALANNTAKLPLSFDAFAIGLATNTKAAIYSGTLTAACGLITFTLNNPQSESLLILTGGDAELIAGVIGRPTIVDPYLVLRGLTLI
jgi:type III pantothenate kinase